MFINILHIFNLYIFNKNFIFIIIFAFGDEKITQ